MVQEEMALTKEIKQKLYNCLTGKSTTEIERNKVGESMDNKYKYTYEKTADYCYQDTDVLISKLEHRESFDTDIFSK